MRIAIFEIQDWERGAFQQFEGQHELLFSPDRLTTENVVNYPDIDILSVFIYSDVNARVLQSLGNPRLIATRSTGFDHIDTDYCQEQGITICNVPIYGSNTVAEHVFALLLAISHNLVEAVDRTRRGDFSLTGLRGFDLQGKTLGVVGTGSIGEHVIRIAQGFEMQVLAYDVFERDDLAEELGFDYVTMEELLAQSDIVTLHVPGNPKTRHMISGPQLDQMKDGAVLINTARGDVIDINALVGALATGKLAAAGLDVMPDEPSIREEAELVHSFYEEQYDLRTLLAGHILLRMRNVIITPHSAFNTHEAMGRILETTVENMERFMAGEPQNVVEQ
jgi:D-lactate dehydrogenase